MQTSLGRAQLLAGFELFDGKPEKINTLLDRYAAVTPAQVQAVAKKYLSPERRTVLAVLSAPATKTGAPATEGGF